MLLLYVCRYPGFRSVSIKIDKGKELLRNRYSENKTVTHTYTMETRKRRRRMKCVSVYDFHIFNLKKSVFLKIINRFLFMNCMPLPSSKAVGTCFHNKRRIYMFLFYLSHKTIHCALVRCYQLDVVILFVVISACI